jgi:flagellar protein FlgJ
MSAFSAPSDFSSQANLAMQQGRTLPSLNAAGSDSAALKQGAEKFTAMFMSQMFSQMFEGVGTNKLFGGGAGEEMFKSVLIDEYGKAAAKQGGMGMTDKIMHALIAQQEVQS